MKNYAITIKNISKNFTDTEVIKNLSLDIKKGEVTAIFGPNGSGKSTLLNILSGSLSQDSGEIAVDSKESLGYCFQNYSETLLPWLTNRENIALPLRIRGVAKDKRSRIVEALHNKLGFDIDLDAYPYELSGGQRQFLVFARTLITKPKILLLDEPFSALDYENSLRLRTKLGEYQRETGTTVVVVTHNIEEAVWLADKIVILTRKPTQVLGTIKNPLSHPRTLESSASTNFHKVKEETIELFSKAAI